MSVNTDVSLRMLNYRLGNKVHVDQSNGCKRSHRLHLRLAFNAARMLVCRNAYT